MRETNIKPFNKEPQFYLVKYESDWSDEMDIKGLSILTDRDKSFFESLTSDNFPLFHCVGTNEEIQYGSKETLLNKYTWTAITEQERAIIENLIGNEYGHFYYPSLDEEF